MLVLRPPSYLALPRTSILNHIGDDREASPGVMFLEHANKVPVLTPPRPLIDSARNVPLWTICDVLSYHSFIHSVIFLFVNRQVLAIVVKAQPMPLF